MRMVKYLALVVLVAGLSACSSSKFRTYNGPEVTSIVVNKGARNLYLLNNQTILKEYRFGLGFAPIGAYALVLFRAPTVP